MNHEAAPRLRYLDWLRVLAVLGVFLFHAVHPFDATGWHIKNAVTSDVVTLFVIFMFPWGMPFFFLLAGAGSYLALRRRSPGAFARERVQRLLIPYLVGALTLMPLMLYFEWRHKTQTGLLSGPFLDFALDRNRGFTPVWFGALGYHLWFLGFLFSFSLLGLPLMRWLAGAAGQRFTALLARLAQRRGALLLAILPLAALRLGLHPFFPVEHSWADFAVQFAYFLLGYLLFSAPAFLEAVRRDWAVHLGLGLAAFALGAALVAVTGSLDVYARPRALVDWVFWLLIAIDGWCLSLFVLHLGQRYLNAANKYLDYGQAAVLPFFVLHQPVIIVLAYYVVQWPAAWYVKAVCVVAGSFAVTLGLYEFGVRRVRVLARLFGMKPALAARRAPLDAAS